MVVDLDIISRSKVSKNILSRSAVHACGSFTVIEKFSKGVSRFEFVIPFNSSPIFHCVRMDPPRKLILNNLNASERLEEGKKQSGYSK